MYYNRDLSWLGFNRHVLQEAADPGVPLMERLRFLSIYSSNLDEFFRVRYPAIVAISRLSDKTKRKIEAEIPGDIVIKVQAEIGAQQEEFGHILTQELLPELEQNNIILYYNRPIQEKHKKEIKDIFLSKVLSFIQPVFLTGDTVQQFIPENNRLYLLALLTKQGDDKILPAIVNIPSDRLSRFFSLSPIDGKEHIVFIDDIMREHITFVFPGFNVSATYSIKFNRDAELHLEDEYEGNLLRKMEKQLKKRDFGPPSRFLYEAGMPRNLQLFIAGNYGIEYEEMFEGGRYHNLKDLAILPVNAPWLSYEKWNSMIPPLLRDGDDVFGVMEDKDLLIHLPYESYNPILSFFNQAAIDPGVSEIYITLYRVAADSHIVNALISAAKNGKSITAFIEIKARFDEANNIYWSKLMKEAGVRIIYSIPDIKVHSKIALVKRKTQGGDGMYAILSTGNFNENTARFYTDHALLTTDNRITGELLTLFRFLETKQAPVGAGRLKFDTLYVSQFNMISRFEKQIDKQVKLAKKGAPARIRIKLNNLEEPYMIDLLYKASKAGVQVQLIVRSICCIVPGVSGESEHVTVKRIVDRYLEHTRLFIFGEGDDSTVIMGSSDWMTRNLKHRIEVCTPVTDPGCRKELTDYFDLQWQDNDKAVTLGSDMQPVPIQSNGQELHNAQTSLYQYLRQRV